MLNKTKQKEKEHRPVSDPVPLKMAHRTKCRSTNNKHSRLKRRKSSDLGLSKKFLAMKSKASSTEYVLL